MILYGHKDSDSCWHEVRWGDDDLPFVISHSLSELPDAVHETLRVIGENREPVTVMLRSGITIHVRPEMLA